MAGPTIPLSYPSPAKTLFSPRFRLPAVETPSRYRARRLVRPPASTPSADADHLLPLASVEAAALRFRESSRPDPLFIDPYAGCFVSSVERQFQESGLGDGNGFPSSSHYVLATRFIDDKVVDAMKSTPELRQVVLLTDGVDTRPYRLQWPHSMLIFDISPGIVFGEASKMLGGIGAKIPKHSLLIHVPFHSSKLPEALCQKGFNGSKPSMWVLQGLPLMTLAEFEEMLSIVSSLAMKDSILVGELPNWLTKTEIRSQNTVKEWMERNFMKNGFQVYIIEHDVIAKTLHREPPTGVYKNILFVAKQLRLSDDQMEKWRMEFQRIEDDGDEEGFVDMLF